MFEAWTGRWHMILCILVSCARRHEFWGGIFLCSFIPPPKMYMVLHSKQNKKLKIILKKLKKKKSFSEFLYTPSLLPSFCKKITFWLYQYFKKAIHFSIFAVKMRTEVSTGEGVVLENSLKMLFCVASPCLPPRPII